MMKMIAMSTFAGTPLIAGLTMTLAVGSAFAATTQDQYSEQGSYRMSRYAADPALRHVADPAPGYLGDPPPRYASNHVCTIDSTYLGRPYCFGGEGLPYGWSGTEGPGY
jgi:hypothetical protein